MSSRNSALLVDELGERVRFAVELLLQARAPLVDAVWNELDSDELYLAACRFVMRFVVTLFAESRGLLPVDRRDDGREYGLVGLLDQLEGVPDVSRRVRHVAWPRLLSLFDTLHRGSSRFGIPSLGGDLFAAGDEAGSPSQRAVAWIETPTCPVDDDIVVRMLRLVSRTTQTCWDEANGSPIEVSVDFGRLPSEYIGVLYEGLLDYHVRRAADVAMVVVGVGNYPAIPLDRLEAMDDDDLVSLARRLDRSRSRREKAVRGALGREGASSVAGTNDDRVRAWERASRWARRAVEVAGVVDDEVDARGSSRAYLAERRDRMAELLVVDVKLPGELFLVRLGGARKGGGSFYTRPELTLPTVQRTLELLIYEDEPKSGGCSARSWRAPEALLALNVCDPAMGAGSFLVAAARVLSRALVESLRAHGRLHEDAGRVVVSCELLPEDDRSLPVDGIEMRLAAVARRAVIQRCLYGVDVDPLAVELARVTLWIEMGDRRLSGSLLEQKLRCGDALVGAWMDRVQHYPLLCFDRQSPDRGYQGGHHEPNVWLRALRLKRREAIRQQVRLLGTQEGGVEDDSMMEVDSAVFDTWCALWFWPLDKLDVIPLPGELKSPSEQARVVVDAVRDEKRFFHWELEFPDVFTEPGAGFDAMVGNPPWEIRKPNSKEFFSKYDPLYSTYTKQEALAAQRALFEQDPSIEARWLTYDSDFKALGNFVKHAAEPFGDGKLTGVGGSVSLSRGSSSSELHGAWGQVRARHRGRCDPQHPFRYQGAADLNTYKMFVEQAFVLLREGGALGFLVPSAVHTDKGSRDLRRLLLQRCDWRWLYCFENRNKIFDIHRSFKFCVLIASKGGSTDRVRTAFMRHDPDDWANAKAVVTYPAAVVSSLSPRNLSMPELRCSEDLRVLEKLYGHGVRLGDDGRDGWGVSYTTELHMTNDSNLFIPREDAESQGFEPGPDGRWVNQSGEVLLPLLQGVMLGSLQVNRVGHVEGRGLSARWERMPSGTNLVRPQYLVRASRVSSKWAGNGPRIGFRPIARTTDRRTFISSIIPPWPAGNSVGLLTVPSVERLCPLAAVLGSLVFDWQVRLRQSGSNVNWFLLAEMAVPIPTGTEVLGSLVASLFPQQWLREATEPHKGRPGAWTPRERFRLRIMLDAIVAHLYGLERDEFAWILRDCDHPTSKLSDRAFRRRLDPKGFWRVDGNEPPEQRQTVLSLAAFDDLRDAIARRGGDRNEGIRAFCDQHDGYGWRVPETLCVADLGIPQSCGEGSDERRSRG